jgi:hypothetical protein
MSLFQKQHFTLLFSEQLETLELKDARIIRKAGQQPNREFEHPTGFLARKDFKTGLFPHFCQEMLFIF